MKVKKKRKGYELEFISQIERDGSGTKHVKESYLEFLNAETFRINALSFTHKTFIASGFNSFVVTLKENK